jgi:predicted nucleotidyltransferase
MNRQEILDLLHEHLDEIQRRYDVKQLGLFGSAARDEMTEESDVDILVEFNGHATFDGYMDLKIFLEELFHRDVDLVTRDAIKPRMRPIIEKDEIRVA